MISVTANLYSLLSRAVLFVLLCLVLLGSTLTQAAESPTDVMKALSLNLIDKHTIPAYQLLGEHVEILDHHARDYCQNEGETRLLVTREAFHQSMDAWQRVQFLRFGPIETMMRVHSIQFWPDKKHHVRKQLDQLIKSNDEALLGLDAMYRQPVSIRGLPAIEILLFTRAPLAGFSCKTLVAITHVLKADTTTLADEWRSMRKHFESFGDDMYFADATEAGSRLLGSILDQLEFMADVKISGVIGPMPEEVKVKQMESWRSLTSLRNLEANVDMIQHMYADEGGLNVLFSSDENTAVQDRFALLLHQLHLLRQHVPAHMEVFAETERGHEMLRELATQLRGLKQHLESLLKQHGVYLGFNSRDGD